MAMLLGINLIVFMAWATPFVLFFIREDIPEMSVLIIIGVLVQALMNVTFLV